MVRLLCRKSGLYRIVALTLLCFTSGIIVPAQSMCAPAAKQETPKLSIKERERLVQKGVAHYEQKELTKAQENLEQAKAAFPQNYAVPYYLGLIYLEQGDRKGAIAQWKQYVKMDPQSENAQQIRKNITLLLLEEAREFAKQAVAQEAEIDDAKADENTIAITNFNNLGSEILGPLGKGMASMLIADLSQVKELNVVDRIKLQALLEEIELGTSGLVNMKTAPKVGKLLKAKHVTSGTLADIEKENLVIASAVVDTNKNTSVGAQEAKGALKKFYDMEKEIACQILEDLDMDCKTIPGDFNKIHTKSVPALVAYSWGLDHFDRGNYDKAREMFQKSLDEDPNFDLAMAALLATPPSTMAAMDKNEIISNTSSSGVSSAASGTAVAGSTAAIMASAPASSSMGISPMTAIGGGVAILGGGLALAGGGGGGGGGGEPQPSSTLSLTGDWKGFWNADGEATFILTQTDGSVRGSVVFSGNSCSRAGQVSGSVVGKTVNLVILVEPDTINWAAELNSTDKTLTGTLAYQASDANTCLGRTGNFTIALTTGGAGVGW